MGRRADAESSFQPFHLLRAELRAAAEILGYTEASWNAELSDVKRRRGGSRGRAAGRGHVGGGVAADARRSRLRAAFERDPALWDDLRLVVRVESTGSDLYTHAPSIACEPRRVIARRERELDELHSCLIAFSHLLKFSAR